MTPTHPAAAFLSLFVVVLATERLTELARTAFPAWLDAAGIVDPNAARLRRLRLQAVAFAAALLAAGCIVPYGVAGGFPPGVALLAVALAGSGGAAFWSQCLRLGAATCGAAVTRRARERLRLRREAARYGVVHSAGGRGTAAAPGEGDRRGRLLLQLHAHVPEWLDSDPRRVP